MSERKDRGKNPPDETMRVRVRSKNPLIERKRSASDEPDTSLKSNRPKPAADVPTKTTARPGATLEGYPTPQLPPRPAKPAAAAALRPGPLQRPDRDRPREDPRAQGRGTRPEEGRARLIPKRPEAPAVQESPFMDDDATEIAGGPPPIPGTELVVRRPRDMADPRHERAPQTAHAMPKGRMVMGGTDAAGALAAQARIARSEDELLPTRVPLLKVLRGRLEREPFEALERALLGELDNRDLRAATSSPKRLLERLFYASEFNALEPSDQVRLVGPIAEDPRDVDTIRSAHRLAATGVLHALGAKERGILLALFGAVAPGARSLLAGLAERNLHNRSALEDRDFEDNLLVDHLHALALGVPAPRIETRGVRMPDVLATALAMLAHPERMPIEEGSPGVLGAIEFALADSSPAECARLFRHLVSGDLVAELPGGESLDLGAHLLAHPDLELSGPHGPLRAGLELLGHLAHPKSGGPQASAKQAPSGAARAPFLMPGGQGIDADVIARALGLLYGVSFTVAAGPPAALRHLEGVSADRHRVPPAFISLLYEGGERLFVFDRLEGGTVLFRAPHGTSSKTKGGRRLDPERQVEDPEQGLESVPPASFKANGGVALVPRT